MSKSHYIRPPMFTNREGYGIEGTPEGVAEDAAKAERKAQTAARIKSSREKSATRSNQKTKGYEID